MGNYKGFILDTVKGCYIKIILYQNNNQNFNLQAEESKLTKIRDILKNVPRAVCREWIAVGSERWYEN